MIKKRFLIVCRQPPYGASFAREALDVAMAAAAFDQPVAMLFLGDGVLQLIAEQHSESIGQKAHDKQLSALPLYDVETLYVDGEALQARQLKAADLVLPAQLLGPTEISALLADHDIVLGF
jgi:tRNA 2-thiouridine synthesizing protein C